MNLDERINYLLMLVDTTKANRTDLVKQLIREVVEYVKPDYLITSIEPASNSVKVYNLAIDKMEAKAKELGL